MIEYTIFIVDDDESIRIGLTMALKKHYRIYDFPTAEEALDAIPEKMPDLLLLDITLPGMDGVSALKHFLTAKPDLLIIMVTALEKVDTVISCMKSGAYDYVVKPINMKSMRSGIAKALETIRLRKEIQLLQQRYLEENLPCFIGESNAIHEIMEFIEMVASSPDTPILILGESGTGKEYIANAIHYKSPNFQGPFVSINCSAIPVNLIESELFGYKTGAFSGAMASGKKGLVEAADGGTLFLDEIGDMPVDVQAKLLRFLEEGEFYKLGSVEKSTVQTRIVSATNKNLEKMVAEDTFRKDLFFRLNVVSIRVPSLNERKEDILLLAKYFLELYNKKFSKSLTGISSEVEEILLQYSWSGNVRELRNLMERGVLICRDKELTRKSLGIEKAAPVKTINAAGDAPTFPALSPDGIDLEDFHRRLDQFYFEKALEMAGGNETAASKLLNINYHTFRNRRKKFK